MTTGLGTVLHLDDIESSWLIGDPAEDTPHRIVRAGPPELAVTVGEPFV